MSDATDLTIETQSLPIPEEVFAEPLDRVAELVRVWWAGDQPRMMIRPAAEDPMLIGIILSDLAWHFSNAYAVNGRMEQKAAFDRIIGGWTEGHRMRAEAQDGASQ